ncbi:hypothetical protein [Deinococcus alpinitundrae]|uniref:hypothetical protein n=1 Tax=Deinococcus alpinitundrae TaxID=468913 RepID=UPI0013795077|nr:hypothetical protein [Deinococcus alpinitundrae]
MTKVTESKITADKSGRPVRQKITLTNDNGSSTGTYEVHNGKTVLVKTDYKVKQGK